MKVLLVEDDALVRFVVSEMLEELGMECVSCADGSECLDQFDDEVRSFNMIILDIHMPVKSGLDVVREIREGECKWPTDIPIIALTADSYWQEDKRASDIGFTGVLAKPVTTGALRACMEQTRRAGSPLA